MPYYGNPESLRILNKNIASLSDAELTFDEQVAAWNSLVVVELEADLYSVFTSWPDPDSTDLNVISKLWALLMTRELQAAKFATNSVGQPSSYGEEIQGRYDMLLEDIKSGRKLVPGAVRHSAGPTQSSMARRRWDISESEQPNEPEGSSDVLQRGLRR